MDNVVVLQNNLRAGLLCMTLNAIAVIQNSIIIANIVSKAVYNHSETSGIQLINVEFTRNYTSVYSGTSVTVWINIQVYEFKLLCNYS